MKKHLVVNILFSLVFIASDPLLDWCGDWADMYSLGAEMVLGMLIPFILVLFVLFVVASVLFSLYKTILAKDIKQTIPTLVLIAFGMLYLALSTQDSLWVRVFEYYK